MHRVSEQDWSRNQIARTRRDAQFLLAVSLAVGAFLRPKIFSFNQLEREARVGIEPTHTAFAEPRLTTWLPRHPHREYPHFRRKQVSFLGAPLRVQPRSSRFFQS